MNAHPKNRSKADGERTLEVVRRQDLAAPRPTFASRQNFRLLFALSLLIVALAVVLIKDRDFWFGPEQAVESESAPEAVANNATPAPVAPAPAQPQITAKTQAPVSKLGNAAKTQSHPAVAEVAKGPATEQKAPVVASKRVVLPPLDVEVIAGELHRTVHPGSSVAKVEIPAASAAPSTNVSERERLSNVSIPTVRQNIDANYPLLGQNARVQGSVVLQAVIGADGNVENLRVLSGPAILATAAQQAVRQWRFKPILQNGQPVETKTRITVNFSIRVAGTPSTAS